MLLRLLWMSAGVDHREGKLAMEEVWVRGRKWSRERQLAFLRGALLLLLQQHILSLVDQGMGLGRSVLGVLIEQRVRRSCQMLLLLLRMLLLLLLRRHRVCVVWGLLGRCFVVCITEIHAAMPPVCFVLRRPRCTRRRTGVGRGHSAFLTLGMGSLMRARA